MKTQLINFKILTALFFLSPLISNAQICWQQVSTISDSYLRVVKTGAGNYLSNAANISNGSAINPLYESNDMINWTPIPAAFPSHMMFGFNVNQDGKIYLATGHAGVYQSVDNGISWSYNFASGYGCGSLDVEFDNSHGTYVGVGGSCRGLHLSTDDGVSWTNKIPGMDFTDIQFIASTNQVYACNTNFGVFVSNDNGGTWSQITNQPFSSSTSMIKYWQGNVLIFDNTGAVYSSSDAGASWNLNFNLPFTSNSTPYLNDAVFVDDNIAWVNFYPGGLFRTEDGGQTWNSASNCLSGEVHYMFYDQGILLATTSDGIYAYSECNVPATVSTTDSTTFCEGSNATLTANTGSGYQYQWQMNGVDIFGANASDLIVDSAGDYTVVIQSGLSCTSTSSPIQIETLQNQNYFSDADADGYGDSSNLSVNCIQPVGYVSNGTDCNDNDAIQNPIATETCNNLDDNCNNQIDEGLSFFNYYSDSDGDGFGTGVATSSCIDLGAGYTLNNTDCDDSNAAINPNAEEIGANGIDENCDGQIDNSIEELSNQMLLYPNPATTELNLQIPSDLIGTDLFVFDALGKQILKQQILSTNTIINASSFAVGNYVVKVGGGVKKFNVEK